MGTLFIFAREAHILIDLGSTHSFVSRTFAMYVKWEPEPLDCDLVVSTPTRGSLLAESVYRDCMVRLGEGEFNCFRHLRFRCHFGHGLACISLCYNRFKKKEVMFKKLGKAAVKFRAERKVFQWHHHGHPFPSLKWILPLS